MKVTAALSRARVAVVCGTIVAHRQAQRRKAGQALLNELRGIQMRAHLPWKSSDAELMQ